MGMGQSTIRRALLFQSGIIAANYAFTVLSLALQRPRAASSTDTVGEKEGEEGKGEEGEEGEEEEEREGEGDVIDPEISAAASPSSSSAASSAAFQRNSSFKFK